MNVTVFDFTGIYENESFDFYKKEGFRSLSLGDNEGIDSVYVDLKNISGTNCICDDYAYEEIKRRIAETKSITAVTAEIKQDEAGEEAATAGIKQIAAGRKAAKKSNIGIRFFDNGNYHYMSRILMDEISGNELFDLVVFDHHPDMKWTSYGEILSCGCWVLKALKDIAGLSKVYIIGADKKLMEEAFLDNPETEGRVFYYENCEAFYKMLEDTENIKTSRNVYISVDKDVLSGDELYTNWDQGEMTVKELCDCLGVIKKYYRDNILAVDVCGECTMDDEKALSPLGFEGSNRINKLILSAL